MIQRTKLPRLRSLKLREHADSLLHPFQADEKLSPGLTIVTGIFVIFIRKVGYPTHNMPGRAKMIGAAKVDRCVTFDYRCVRQIVVGAARGKERSSCRRFCEGPIDPQLKEFPWPSGQFLSIMGSTVLLSR